jgi:protein Tex
VRGGEHPLDATAVHPERYALVERMAADSACRGGAHRNDALVDRIELSSYMSDDVGLPTLRDIVDELRVPAAIRATSSSCPRSATMSRSLRPRQPGMKLEGVVTNLVAFGAFVDIGVHQDGLVHVSQLADRFVKDRRSREGRTEGHRHRPQRRSRAEPHRAQHEEGVSGTRQNRPARPQEARRPQPAPKKGDIAPNGMRFR